VDKPEVNLYLEEPSNYLNTEIDVSQY
jgi:hypothetical protein